MLLPGYYNYWEDWLLFHNAIFDGANSLIYIDPSVSDVDIKIKLYSDWKEWMQLRDNTKYLPAMRAAGGDPLPGNRFLGSTFFLTNGWRIVVEHGVTYDGNLYTEEGDSAFIVRAGNELSASERSNLVDFIDIPDSISNAEAVRSELAIELANLDAAVSTRAANTVEVDITLIRKLLVNRLDLSENATDNHVLYDDDDSTPLLTFTVTDRDDTAIQLPSGVPARRTRGT